MRASAWCGAVLLAVSGCGSDDPNSVCGNGVCEAGESGICMVDCAQGVCAGACDALRYTECTCGASDPCGWALDGECDNLCLTLVTTPFDDSGDCAALPNGSVCSANNECESGNCGTSVGGDRFCYGDVMLGQGCTITQDCAVGFCRNGTCAQEGSCQNDFDCRINEICDTDSQCLQVCGANAYVTSTMTCMCLPGFVWASSDPNDTTCVPEPSGQPGCHVYAQDVSETYLGEWGDCFGLSSICNDLSNYGSSFGLYSIYNDFGQFGSDFGLYSAYNDFAINPPLLVCDGIASGCVSKNQFAICDGFTVFDPDLMCSCF